MSAAVMPRRGPPAWRVRHAIVVAHRWLGLATAAFLIVLGLTGSLIAFNDEIEAWISPGLFRASPPHAGAPMLDPFVLRERVLAQYPGTALNWVDLAPSEGRSVIFGLEPAPNASKPLPNDQVFVDPYTGRVLGERLQADLSQGWKNVMPFVYALHTSLALGDMGTIALGIAALLWTIDCFIGFYLTLPARRGSRAGMAPSRRPLAAWRTRWAPAWKVRWRSTVAKLNFDLHRAGGLWTWVMLFVLAWSGVAFNLAAVYQPVMRAISGYVEPGWHGTVASPQSAPLGWQRARQLAQAAMADAAASQGFGVRRERLIHHDPVRGLYEYRVLSTLDVGDKLGNTTLFLDAATGAVLHLDVPTGRHVGNTLDTWLSSLHTASWGGAAMQIIVCGVGVVVVMLSVTGLWIWWQRRRARHSNTSRFVLDSQRASMPPL